MRAELFVELPVLAFAEQVKIDFTHDRPVLIRIAHRVLRPVPVGYAQMVIEFAGRVRNFRLKETVAMDLLCLDRRLTVLHDVDLARVRAKRANRKIVPHPMRPQNTERIGMGTGKKTVQLIRR